MSKTNPDRDRIVFPAVDTTSRERNLASGSTARHGDEAASVPGWVARNKDITALFGAGVLSVSVGVAAGAGAVPSGLPYGATTASASSTVVPSAPAGSGTSSTSGTMDSPATQAPEQPSATAAPTTAAAADPAPSSPTPDAAAVTWTVSNVVDGDTVDATKAGTSVRIRVIGIDTPEIGQCGYLEATANMKHLLAGKQVNLIPGARDDRDRYGRYLRYLDVDGTDAGLRQIQAGFAIARYDSRDGYGQHPREAAYITADTASPPAACSTAATPTPALSKPVNPAPQPTQPAVAWPLPGDRHPCPQTKPIKGNQSSMIAHSPGQQSYLVTNPEACFANLTDAAAAGYRPAQR